MLAGDPSDNYDDDQEFDIPSNGASSSQKASSSKQPPMMDEDDEEDEEEDEEDDDEEEDDDDMDQPTKKKRKVRRKVLNRFLDTEAIVDDSDEEAEEDEEEYTREAREFIATGDDDVHEDNLIAAGHHRFARREYEETEQDLTRVAQELKERYSRSTARFNGDSMDVPQRLLMPGVKDASLWQVRVRPGKERDLILQLMRKSMDLQYTSQPLEILSAFERDSLPGMIYVEAKSQHQVKHAVAGLVGVFPTRPIVLVPIDEMASLLRIKKRETTLTPGSWVRIRRGKYAGDLAQVLDVTDNGEEAGLKFIPRIDLTPREDFGDKKRKKGAPNAASVFRPPQRFFNAEEVSRIFRNKVTMKPGHSRKFVFQGDTYNNGFIEKDVKITGLITENVNPTLDEIARFTAGDQEGAEGGDNSVDLSIIAADARKAATAVLQPGDHVEVFEGQQTGMHGIVESINGDIVTLRPQNVDIEDAHVEVPAASVRKRFKAGDHIKVMSGKNSDESGLVVSILNDTVTFLSDMSLQEVTVFAKDVREAAEVGAGTNIVGNYELHDLVQLDQQTVGVIYKTERDSFRVLDQNGSTRIVHPHQITMRKDSRRAIATDAQGYEIRIGDNMKESEGEGRKGIVLHIHQSFYAFLHNRDVAENGGVFVTRARGLVSVAPKGAGSGPDLTKMNPAVHQKPPVGGMVGSASTAKSGKDRLVGVSVMVVQGPFKGYLGVIKDTNGAICRVELHTQNKVITIEKTKLRRRGPDGKPQPLEGGSFNFNGRPGGGMGPPPNPNGARATPNPYANGGGMTPGARRFEGRTPNPYGDGGRTPFGGDGGRTPGTSAWAASSKTPNPYAAGRTPNPYANDGGRTPFGGAFGGGRAGGATPNPYTARSDPRVRPGTTPAGAGASAGGWGASPSNDWGAPADDWGAPTPGPANAPTPGVFANSSEWGADAQTPGVYAGAPTPYASAPTPGLHAQTPGMYPQTPGVFGQTPGLAAATPGITAPTPGPGSFWGDSSHSHRDHWLIGCQSVYAKVSPSEENEDSWHAGNFDGFDVLVLTVQDKSASSEGFTSTALCRFLEGPERNSQRTIPLEYLQPVAPAVGDLAMLISGEGRHKVVNVLRISSEVAWIVDDEVAPGMAASDYARPIPDLTKYQK